MELRKRPPQFGGMEQRKEEEEEDPDIKSRDHLQGAQKHLWLVARVDTFRGDLVSCPGRNQPFDYLTLCGFEPQAFAYGSRIDWISSCQLAFTLSPSRQTDKTSKQEPTKSQIEAFLAGYVYRGAMSCKASRCFHSWTRSDTLCVQIVLIHCQP